jgi:hypothetical protein
VTEVLEKLEPFEVRPSGLLVPGERSITYPGNDAWLEVDPKAAAPSGDPAWLQIETTPDSNTIPNKVITAQGANPPTTQSATSVFGGSSLLFPNLAGTALQAPGSDDWWFSNGDWTLEFRGYITLARKALYTVRDAAGLDLGWELTMDAGSSSNQQLTFYYSTVTANNFDVQVDWPFTATLNQWYHFACVRSGTTIRGYVNGTQVGTDHTVGTTTLRKSSAILTIGGDNRSAGGNDFRGYADELRISKGIARWTGPFTVPGVPYTRDAYTVLLMHADGPDGGTAYTDSSGVPGTPFDPGTDPAWLEIER